MSAEGFFFFWHHIRFHPAFPDWNGWECVNKAWMFGQDLPPVFPVSGYRLLVCLVSLKDKNISLAAPLLLLPPTAAILVRTRCFGVLSFPYFFFCFLSKAKSDKMFSYWDITNNSHFYQPLSHQPLHHRAHLPRAQALISHAAVSYLRSALEVLRVYSESTAGEFIKMLIWASN